MKRVILIGSNAEPVVQKNKLVRSSAVAIVNLLASLVGAAPFRGEYERRLTVVKLPPLEVRLFEADLLSALEELVLLKDLLFNVTDLEEVLSFLWLQGLLVFFLLDLVGGVWQVLVLLFLIFIFFIVILFFSFFVFFIFRPCIVTIIIFFVISGPVPDLPDVV